MLRWEIRRVGMATFASRGQTAANMRDDKITRRGNGSQHGAIKRYERILNMAFYKVRDLLNLGSAGVYGNFV